MNAFPFDLRTASAMQCNENKNKKIDSFSSVAFVSNTKNIQPE